MAEIGTLIAVIQLADRVIELSKYWIEGVRDAESDLRSILVETSMLRSVLENIRFLSDCSDGLATTLAGLSLAGGPLGHCQKLLDDIASLIPTKPRENGQKLASGKDHMKVMVAKLGWAAKRSQAQKLLDELQRYKSAISMALITESLQDIKEIKTTTNLVYEALSDAEKRDFYRWYQQTDPSSLHNRAWEQFEEGTCEWIQRLPEWNDWLTKNSRCLLIYGIPGAGKTILATYLVHQLESHCESQTDSIALYYYCYFARNRDEAVPFLRWITTQLCRHTNSVPASAYHMFKKGREPSLPDLLTTLGEIIEPFQTIYIVVDALDESKPRNVVLKVLRDLITDPRFDKIQVVATSREYIDIERALEDISTPVSMSNPSVTQDIATHVRSILNNSPRFRRWSKELLLEVESTLAARAKGMFRWAICQLDRLQRLKGDAIAVRKALETLPRTLDETYQRIFAEIPEEERDIVRLCLGWIDFHNDLQGMGMPVTVLLHALNSSHRQQESGWVLDEEDVREICGCLVSISQGLGFKHIRWPEYLEKIPVITFAHYTVREFLSINSTCSKGPAAYFALADQLQLDVGRKVLTAAQGYNSVPLCNVSLAQSGDVNPDVSKTDDILGAARMGFTYMVGSLEPYCVYSICWSLVHGPSNNSHLKAILGQPDLVDVIIRLLDPARPHFANIEQLLHRWRGNTGSGVVSPLLSPATELRFWGSSDVAERSRATQDAMHLFALWAHTKHSPDSFLYLAKGFLERFTKCSPVELLEIQIRFERQPPVGDYPLTSSWMEFFVSRAMPFRQHWANFELFTGLSGVPSSSSQATALLHAYSIAEKARPNEGVSSKHYYKFLLRLGADPQGRKGYATTPMQRAAAIFDLEGVQSLVAAGADVNGVGNPGGIIAAYDFDHWFWFEETEATKTKFETWPGKSPLQIFYNHHLLRRRDPYYLKNPDPLRETLEKTADVLIRNGAKALRLEEGKLVEDPGIRDKLMRPYEQWDLA